MADKFFLLQDPESQTSIRLPVKHGSMGPSALDVSRLYADTGMFTYDPGFMATASCDSAITYIDGNEGILAYRGYPIEQLAEQSSYLEVAHLLLHGELPSQSQLADFENIISHHTKLPHQQQKWGQGRANPRSDPDSPGGFGTRQGRFWNAGLAGSCPYYRRWWKRPGGRPEKHAASSFIHSMLINVLTTSRMSTC